MPLTKQQQDEINRQLGAQVTPGMPSPTPFAAPGGPADLPPTLGNFLMELVAREHGGRTLTQQAEDRVGADRAMASGFGARAGGFVPASERAGLQALGPAQTESRARAGLTTDLGTPGEGMYRDVNRWPKSTQPQYNNPARQTAQNHVYDTTGLVSGVQLPREILGAQQDADALRNPAYSVPVGNYISKYGTASVKDVSGMSSRAPAAGRSGSSPSAVGLSSPLQDNGLPKGFYGDIVPDEGKTDQPAPASLGWLDMFLGLLRGNPHNKQLPGI